MPVILKKARKDIFKKIVLPFDSSTSLSYVEERLSYHLLQRRYLAWWTGFREEKHPVHPMDVHTSDQFDLGGKKKQRFHAVKSAGEENRRLGFSVQANNINLRAGAKFAWFFTVARPREVL